jgi:hypothetical protein
MYLQFIHGKLVSNKGSGYQLVARSAALTNEVNLKNMAEGNHRFWGSTPPERKVTAVGIFLQGINLVLVKAETAVEQNGIIAVNGDRGFDQHRYVFIPATSMSALQGRVFKLLVWMLNQPIPLLTRFNADLKSLSIPIVEEPISAETIDKEIDKIRQCLPNSNEQKPLVLMALAAIINGNRLLLTNEQIGIPFQNWMESILLLLPASIRPQISVAVGTLDEHHCPWATLVVKTNKHSSRSLPENMIWLDRVNQIFHGRYDDNTFENTYVAYIRDHITTAPDTLKRLIQQLDKIANNDLTLETLADSKIIFWLIPALPEESQNKFLITYLSGLSIDTWDVLIQLIIFEDYQQGYVFALNEIIRLIPSLPIERQDECLSKYFTGLSIDIWCMLIPLINFEDYQQGFVFARKELLRLIPSLPVDKQDECLSKHFSGLSIDIWDILIPPLINDDYQYGLMFAWIELCRIAISEPQAITLMLQAWSHYDNAKLSLLLDDLNNNLPLAAILLKDNLLIDQPIRESETTTAYSRRADGLNTSEPLPYQPLSDYSEGNNSDFPSNVSNTPPRTSLSSSAIIDELLELCKRVLADQAGSDCVQSWQFAINLAAHKSFADEKMTFLLLDTTLLGEITVEFLYNCFALKLGALLPSIEAQQFKHSNLRQKFITINPEVADLLDTLLAERNLGLAKLPQIASLTDMNYLAKNSLYEAFLRTWAPSKEDARPLLVSVIKQNQDIPNNFSRADFRQIYTWFEQKQPGLNAIFDSLQQDNSCDNWVNLAEAIYETQYEQTEFVDTLVGNIFPVTVMQKWLPLIDSNEKIRNNVMGKSSAWQGLTRDDFQQLVRNSPQYVTTLTRCLRDGDSSRLPWIKGDLLHYLCRFWIQQKSVDEDLKDLITSPSVTDAFTTDDWLFLQCLSWDPGIQLEFSIGVNTALMPDQKNYLLIHAKSMVSRYNDPEETRRLLNHCVGLGLDLAEQKEILKVIQPPGCNVDLIIPYLYSEGKAVNPAEEQILIGLLLQMKLNQEERADVEKFFFDIFTQYILPIRNWAMLKWWRDKAVEEELYKKAFSSAVQHYVQNISITVFFIYIKELKTASLLEESGLMFKATFNWMPDPLIQPIIHFLHSSSF